MIIPRLLLALLIFGPVPIALAQAQSKAKAAKSATKAAA